MPVNKSDQKPHQKPDQKSVSAQNSTVEATNQALERFRASFVRRPDLIHLNNAGQAPTCVPARDQIIAWAGRFSEEGAHVFPSLFQAFGEARSEVADLIGCRTNEVIFTQSAAASISQIAIGMKLQRDDEIIVWDQEYPSNFYPWTVAAQRSGARLVVAKSNADLSTPLATIEKLVTPRTRVVATSWVQYRTGAMLDLQDLATFARSKGIFTCVDIIQGAGCLPLDFTRSGIDAACGASHKWLCASHSPGFIALREEHFEKITPLMVGAMTYGTPDDLSHLDAKIKQGPSRFEPGGLPFIEVIALGKSCRLIRETGIATIAQEAEWLTRKLMHGLREHGYMVSSPHGAHFRGAIINFSPGKDSPLLTHQAIEERLIANGVSFGKREPGIRLSIHAHNTLSDIERTLVAVSRG